MRKLQAEVFQNRGEQVVFVSKAMKLKKGLKDKNDLKKQVLAICKTHSSNKRDDLVVHVLTLKSWSIRSSNSLQSLRIVDGAPQLPFTTVFQDSSLTLKLEFHGKTFKTKLFFVITSLGDKSIIEYTLLELCQRYFGFAPSMINVNPSELQLMATDERYMRRCTLFDEHMRPKGTESPSNGYSSNGPALELESSDDDDGEVKTTSNQGGVNGGNKNMRSLSSHRKSEDSEDNQPVELLSTAEHDELLQILEAEGLTSVTSMKLSDELQSRIHKLEEETGSTLRQWENRGDSSDYISDAMVAAGQSPELFDPIAILVDQLEQVYDELSDMDAWMSNYNLELKTMRKDIQKIEAENERLQVQSRNHENLRLHLATLLSHYAVSAGAIEVLDNLDAILRHDTLSEVEHGGSPAQGQDPALVRLSNTATELSLAVVGKAHLRHLPRHERNSANLALKDSQFAEEAHLRAINQRVLELRDQIKHFCNFVFSFIKIRIKNSADKFRQTIVSGSASDYSQLPFVVRQDSMHRVMTPYRVLIGALQELEDDGFRRVVHEYVSDMGEAYGDVLRNFSTNMGKLALSQHVSQITEFSIQRLTLQATDDANLGDHDGERRNAEGLAQQLVAMSFGSQQELSLAHAYAHTLEQVIPMIMDEQDFLGSTFYSMNEGSNNPTDGTAEFFGGHLTSDQAVRERNETLEEIFVRRGGVLAGLSAFIEKAHAQRDIVQIIFMLVETEAILAEYGKRSKFLRGIFMDTPKGLRPQLENALKGWIEEQRSWVTSTRSTEFRSNPGVLSALRKLPRLVDIVTALWDECTARQREICSQEPYTSQSSKFKDSAVGSGLDLLTTTVLQTVERLSVSLEIADRLRAENFHFAVETLPFRGGSALQRVVMEARKEFEAALDRFVQSCINKHVPHLLSFVREIEALLETCDVSQIVYYKPRSELAAVLQSNSEQNITKGLQGIRHEVEIQLSSNPPVFALVLVSAQDTFLEKFSHYVELVTEGYGDIVRPTLAQVTMLAHTILSLDNIAVIA